MNGFVSIALLLALVASAQAFFYDPATGVFSLLANSQTLANGLVLTSGTTTAYLTSAGIAVGGLGLLAIALAKIALIEGEARKARTARQQRSAPQDMLAEIDNYFQQVSAMDVDDCGKLLVCTLETVSAEERTPEEQLISTLFGETATIGKKYTYSSASISIIFGITRVFCWSHLLVILTLVLVQVF